MAGHRWWCWCPRTDVYFPAGTLYRMGVMQEISQRRAPDATSESHRRPDGQSCRTRRCSEPEPSCCPLDTVRELWNKSSAEARREPPSIGPLNTPSRTAAGCPRARQYSDDPFRGCNKRTRRSMVGPRAADYEWLTHKGSGELAAWKDQPALAEGKFGNQEYLKMKTKRPIAIMVVCALLIIAGAADVVGLGGFVRGVVKLHVIPPLLSMFIVTFAPVITLGCSVGVWMMRSWSVYLYACWAALRNILLFACLGVFSLPAVSVEILVIVVSFYYICGRRSNKCQSSLFTQRQHQTPRNS